MKTKTIAHEATEKDLNEFFLVDKDGDYLKDEDVPGEYSISPGLIGAQIFTEAEAMELINANPDENYRMVMVGDVMDINEYEIHEQK